MRILQLCNKSPWPAKEGGSIAMRAITDSLLSQGHEVKVIAMDTYKAPVTMADVPEDFKKQTRFSTGRVDLRIRLCAALFHLFTPHCYIVKRFDSKDFRNTVRNALQARTYDIVHLEGLYLTPYIKDIRYLSDAKIVLRSHNIEHRIWKRYAGNILNPVKRFYLQRLSRELSQYELQHINDYDGILPITEVDKRFYESNGARGLLMAHPFAIDTGRQGPQSLNRQRDPYSLFHLGSMDWIPNQQGILWFIEHVWKEVYKQYPQLTFSLAGRNMPGWLQKRELPGLIPEGEVEDAHAYMQSKHIMIVPLFSGSGIRIKILEGMLNKNVVITTSIGAEGIDYEPGRHLLIADTAEEFIEQIRWCVENPEEANSIAEQAAELIHTHYTLRASAKRLTAFYKTLLTKSQTHTT
ncbi:MAG: glycosyltransferase family 4 protein [Bacteroidales bacterium]